MTEHAVGEWRETQGGSPVSGPGEFKSVYGQLMTVGPLGLSPRQEAALRDLDGLMMTAEHVLRGTPVGAGAHSTICALLMDAYAKGRASVPGQETGS